MMIWKWIKKKFGYHVCEEFTQWQDYKIQAEVTYVMGNVQVGEPHVTERFVQMRRCTICGELQTRKVNLHV